MAEKKIPAKTVVVRGKPGSPALKIVVTVLILLFAAALGMLRWVHLGIQEQNQALREEAAALEHANTVLEEKTGSPDSVQNVQNIAKEELGLVNPDTIVIDPIS